MEERITYQLRFLADHKDDYYGVTGRAGELFADNNGSNDFTAEQIRRFYVAGHVSQNHGHGVNIYFSFPSDFTIMEVKTITTVRTLERGWNELAKALDVPNYIPFTA